MRNWDEMGVEWEVEDVSKVFGDNQSDKRVVAKAQLPRIVDLDKAIDAGVDILGWLNSANSIRVRAQAIARSGKVKDTDKLRELVWGAILGQRNSGGSRTTVVHNLPDGSGYDGQDEGEFRSLFAAALVDMGVDADVALAKAKLAKW